MLLVEHSLLSVQACATNKLLHQVQTSVDQVGNIIERAGDLQRLLLWSPVPTNVSKVLYSCWQLELGSSVSKCDAAIFKGLLSQDIVGNEDAEP